MILSASINANERRKSSSCRPTLVECKRRSRRGDAASQRRRDGARYFCRRAAIIVPLNDARGHLIDVNRRPRGLFAFARSAQLMAAAAARVFNGARARVKTRRLATAAAAQINRIHDGDDDARKRRQKSRRIRGGEIGVKFKLTSERYARLLSFSAPIDSFAHSFFVFICFFAYGRRQRQHEKCATIARMDDFRIPIIRSFLQWKSRDASDGASLR